MELRNNDPKKRHELESSQGIVFGPLEDGSLNVLDLKSDSASLCCHKHKGYSKGFKVVEKAAASQFPYVDLAISSLPDIGRQAELEQLFSELRAHRHIELCGESGIGKDFTLSYFLAKHYSQLIDAYPDGIILPLLFSEHSLEDILSCLFNCLYESEIPYKPSSKAIKELLQHKKALIIIDQRLRQVTVPEFDKLRQNLPFCSFLCLTFRPTHIPDIVSIPLSGLPFEYCADLSEKYLGYALSSMERRVLRDLCLLLKGNPRDIIQTLVPVQERNTSLLQVYQRVQIAQSDPNYVIRPFIKDEHRLQEKILATLAIFPDHGLTATQLSSILKTPNLKLVLERLRKKGYVKFVNLYPNTQSQDHSFVSKERYRLSRNIFTTLEREISPFNLEPSLNYFLGHSHENENSTSLSINELPPLLSLFRQSLQQSKAYSIIILGNQLANLCLSLGHWGIRKEILLHLSQVTLATSKRTKIFFDLGLQEICAANYEEGIRFFDLATQVQNASDSGQNSLIETYRQLAIDHLSNSNKFNSDEIVKLSEHNLVQESLGLDSQKRKPLFKNAKVAKKPTAFKLGPVACQRIVVLLSASTLLYFISALIFQRFHFTGVAAVPEVMAFRGMSFGYLLASPQHILADHFASSSVLGNGDSFVGQSSSGEPDNVLTASAIDYPPIARANNPINSEIGRQTIPLANRTDSYVTTTSKTSLQNTEYRIDQSSLTISADSRMTDHENRQLRRDDLDSIQVTVPEPGSTAQSNSSVANISGVVTNSSVSHSGGARNLASSIIMEDVSANPPDEILSESMCSFLAQELSYAEQTDHLSPDMYGKMMMEGNCSFWE